MMAQTPPPASEGVVELVLRLVNSNPAVTIIAGIVVGLWAIGKLDKSSNRKPDEMDEADLLAALEKVRSRKASVSNPDLKDLIQRIDRLMVVIEGRNSTTAQDEPPAAP